ncbi:laminin subunit beta-2-like [Anguilla anguilla]|uniref:laminin subunit beta-2-like n=1 Tax=Anguilla anguilla TaxID=7936 RepID=UPI0015B2BAF8|nr:laminin subunit beta-2-like [Anguilla anguilla]
MVSYQTLWTHIAMAGFFILFFLMSALCTAAQLLPSDQQGCAGGSCYPSTGNLLIGRAASLTTTSTCGLRGPERYCIVSHLQDSDKCFLCDSRRPFDPNRSRHSHRIENIIHMTHHNEDPTWWQSENGVESVSIQLNLEAQFHFTHLIMKFKSFRPAAMLIERSADFGRSWKPYRYFAHNCTRAFPSIPAQPLQSIDDVICEERYSDIEPSTRGEVIYKVLDPTINVKDPYSPQIQELLKLTSLRVNFSQLHTLGDSLLDRRPEVLQKYYYSLYQLLVRGSCFCYGHASRCAPAQTPEHIPARYGTEASMIHGRCLCEHNTAGLNCERCRDFYHDLPWSPAERDHTHTCRECNCNGHSNQCHFDMAVYLATGNVSGGVCDDCLHNTMGRNCDMCKSFYYQHPARDIRDPTACVLCDCDPAGSLKEGSCDSHTELALGMIAGQCRCKPNVRGDRCDSCKHGFFGLSSTDPQGCQPCQCDLRGSVPGGSCDSISGDCVCKRHVTGRRCDQCVLEFWGLSLDVMGCRECDCDFGGAYGNRCAPDSGQCDCRPHLHGRRCSEVHAGYFSAPLDFYRYEAEDAAGHAPDSPALPGQTKPMAQTDCEEHLNNQLLRRRHVTTHHQQRAALRHRRCHLQQMPDVQNIQRNQHPGHRVTWSGSGLARVRDGAGLVVTIDNIPFAMEYDIMLRYEPEARTLSPQSAEDWEAVVTISALQLSSSQRCGNVLPSEQMFTVRLPHQRRYVRTERSLCFEPQNRYVVAIRFQRHGAPQRDLGAYLLSDSLVLIPKYTELAGFQGNSEAEQRRREDMLRYMCLDSFMASPMATLTLAPTCASLTSSISAIMHNGALPCLCHPEGSVSAECAGVGGQCQCKPGVAGRRCDRCEPGTFGFGPQGCIACECDSQGSVSPHCDPVSGRCQCHQGVSGRQCATCQLGLWGFPSCRPCLCNGHALTCHPHTGSCLDCHDHTTGHLCDRCVNGFYGNPVLGSGDHCRPCLCPGGPGGGRSNADSCFSDPTSKQIICHCRQGYAGPHCDRCAPGYFGDPAINGGQCFPCQCSGNIDLQDPESCDPRTGRCLKCLYNTDGPLCSACRLGYYGDALQQDCRRCACVLEGTLPSRCNGDQCHCQEQTGACPCRGNVVGLFCDQCAPQHWNFGAERGCVPCDCHPQNSVAPHCSMASGTCECRQGFGGRTCSECEKNYWGEDPQTECRECRCSPLGSETLQCDRGTGVCRCREGVSGQRCDSCARGFVGKFPVCVRCDPCFQQWELRIQQLQQDLGHAQHFVGRLQKSMATRSHTHIRHTGFSALQRSLTLLLDLIHGKDWLKSHEWVYQLLSQATDDLGAEAALIHRQAVGVRGEMTRTVERDVALQQDLSQAEIELWGINTTFTQLRLHLSPESTDVLGLVRGWYQVSLDAERQCRATTGDLDSPVRGSHGTRKHAGSLLMGWRDSLKDKSFAQRRLQWLRNKVCGGHGRGDGGCRSSWWQRLCGGQGCTQILRGSALQIVTNVTDHITTTNKHLQDAAKELQDVGMLSRAVKLRAAGSLLTTQEKTQFCKNSNKELRDLLQEIRYFLSDEGADPKAISSVSERILEISLPMNGSVLTGILKEIQRSVANLTHTQRDSVIEQAYRTQELLQQAQNIQSQANRTEDTTNQTQQRLDAAHMAIKTIEAALETDRKNSNITRSAIIAMEDKILGMENNQTDTVLRLASVRQETESLQRKLNESSVAVQSIRAQANNTAHTARNLNKELEEAQERQRELEERVRTAGWGAQSLGNVSKRVTDIQQQAQHVLKKATEGMETLHRLERKFQENKRRMQDQKAELAILEHNVTAIRDYLRESILKYSSC